MASTASWRRYEPGGTASASSRHGTKNRRPSWLVPMPRAPAGGATAWRPPVRVASGRFRQGGRGPRHARRPPDAPNGCADAVARALAEAAPPSSMPWRTAKSRCCRPSGVRTVDHRKQALNRGASCKEEIERALAEEPAVTSLRSRIRDRRARHLPKPPFKPQQQPVSGRKGDMNPPLDYGADSYRGSRWLEGGKHHHRWRLRHRQRSSARLCARGRRRVDRLRQGRRLSVIGIGMPNPSRRRTP